MGHASLQTTRDPYLGLVTKEAAAEFWNLSPPTGKAKVVEQLQPLFCVLLWTGHIQRPTIFG